MNGCGGCKGFGRHKRWCPAVVGYRAHMYGTMAETAEAIADTLGANDPGEANAAYAMAGRLKIKAEIARDEWREANAETIDRH